MLTPEQLKKLALSIDSSPTTHELKFKSNNALHREVVSLCVTTETTSPMESNADKISRWVDELVNDGLLRSQVIAEMSTALCDKIVHAKSTLSDLKTVITELTTDINNATNKGISLDPFLSKYINIDEPPVDFDIFPYAALNKLGDMYSFMDFMYTKTDYAKASRDSIIVFSNAFERFNQREIKADSVNKLNISPEKKKEIIDYVNANEKDLLHSNIVKVVNTLCSDVELVALRNRMYNTYKRTEKTAASITYLSIIEDMRSVCDAIDKHISGITLPSDVMDQLRKNLKFIENCTELMGFYVQFHRETTFANTAVFNNKMINPDKSVALEEAGITNVDIARYINFIYRSGNITANMGISVDLLVARKAQINEKVEIETEQIRSRVAAGKIEKQRRAFWTVTYGYLIEQPATTIESPSGLSTYVKAKAHALAVNNIAIEDMLYDVLIEQLHKGSIVETLRNRLGNAYIKAVEVNRTNDNQIDSQLVSTINAGVYAELVANFICKRFM